LSVLKLLTWCQEQTCGYHGVNVTDLTTSWRSGLALCALIHRYRSDLIDFDSLDESSVEENTRLGFDVAEREFGISPLMTVEEMSSVEEPDSLSMICNRTMSSSSALTRGGARHLKHLGLSPRG
uniref:Calponin-homology (CH) domain-containing protein n=1 Tax=Maylandia zebra TaxID=106582 RepID=A0A3P9CCB8_9CICH